MDNFCPCFFYIQTLDSYIKCTYIVYCINITNFSNSIRVYLISLVLSAMTSMYYLENNDKRSTFKIFMQKIVYNFVYFTCNLRELNEL